MKSAGACTAFTFGVSPVEKSLVSSNPVPFDSSVPKNPMKPPVPRTSPGFWMISR